MENRDEIIRQAVTRLQSINTLEEYKAAKEDILDMTEAVFKASLNTLKDFIESIFTLEPEEKHKKTAEFQDPGFMFDPEIGKEMERLESIPGVQDYSESFIPEFEKRMGPYIQEIGKELHKLMDDTMGAIVGEMAAAGGIESEAEVIIDDFEFDYKNLDTPQMLYHLYMSRTLDELLENNELIIEAIEEQMQEDLSQLDTLTDTSFKQLEDFDLPYIEEIRHRHERLVLELNKEFERIAALPDAAEAVLKIKKEIMDRFAHDISKLSDYLVKADELAKKNNLISS